MDDLQLQERITSLERELVSTKLQLACARSTEDSLKHQLAKMRLALSKATSSNAPASHSASSRADGAENDSSGLHRLNYAIIEVPTGNPLSRKKSGDDLDVHRPRKVKKVLNPGSCASALNLYAEIDAPLHPSPVVDSRGGGELSLRRPVCNNRAYRHEFALLFGSLGTSAAPSINGGRRGGSWNNPTRVGNNPYTNEGSAKGNAEWGEMN